MSRSVSLRAVFFLSLLGTACGSNPSVSDPPSVDAVAFVQTSAFTNGSIQCVATVTGTELARRWSWRNTTRNVDLDGTTDTLSLTYADAKPGDTVTCTIEVDGEGGAQATGEATVSIANRAPVLLAIDAPATVVNSDTLPVCTATAEDADGGALTITTYWEHAERRGVRLSSPLTPSDAAPGDDILCVASVEDGDGGETTETSSTPTHVTNRHPSITALSLTPAAAFNDTTLTCVATASDPDGSAASVAYAWTNETTAASLAAGDTFALSGAVASPGDVIRCTATASDGLLTTSDTVEVTLEDRAPAVTGLAISAGYAYEGDSVECAAMATDPDGGSVTVTYAWSNATTDAPLGSGSALTLDPSFALAGQGIRCTVTAVKPSGVQTLESVTIPTYGVNTRPVLTLAAGTESDSMLTVEEDGGLIEIKGFATVVDDVPPEAIDPIRYELVVAPRHPSLSSSRSDYLENHLVSGSMVFATGGEPTIDASGTLRFTLEDDMWGVTDLRVTAIDDGGAISAAVPFTLLVASVPEGFAEEGGFDITVTGQTDYRSLEDLTPCIEITLSVQGPAQSPSLVEHTVVELLSLPAKGTLSVKDCSKIDCIGAPATLGLYPPDSKFCFTPEEDGHSVPAGAPYATFRFGGNATISVQGGRNATFPFVLTNSDLLPNGEPHPNAVYTREEAEVRIVIDARF